MRVRLRSRPSCSMPLRARSTAAASAVPSLGTWLRRVAVGAAAGDGLAGSPLAIVM